MQFKQCSTTGLYASKMSLSRRIKREELFQVKGDQRHMTTVIYDPGPEKIFSIKALFEQLWIWIR